MERRGGGLTDRQTGRQTVRKRLTESIGRQTRVSAEWILSSTSTLRECT